MYVFVQKCLFSGGVGLLGTYGDGVEHRTLEKVTTKLDKYDRVQGSLEMRRK